VQDHRRAGPTESVEVTEQVVVEQVRAGDRDAYAVLVRLYAVAASRAAVLFGAGPDAEDVVQTAFLKAYHAFSRFQDGAEFRPWLLRFVINEAKNTARANGRGSRDRPVRRGGRPAHRRRSSHVCAGRRPPPPAARRGAHTA
jgi:DNA-directed RNA polymerase specialized sigma24 family protein